MVNELCNPNTNSKTRSFAELTCNFNDFDVSKRYIMTHVYMWITLWIRWIKIQKVTYNLTFDAFCGKKVFLQVCRHGTESVNLVM